MCITSRPQSPPRVPTAHGPKGVTVTSTHPPRHRGRPHESSLKSCNLSSCSKAHPTDSRELYALGMRACQRPKHGHTGSLVEPQHWPQRLPGQYRQLCHPRRAPRHRVNRAHPGQDLPHSPTQCRGPSFGKQTQQREAAQGGGGRQTWKGHCAALPPRNGEAQRG